MGIRVPKEVKEELDRLGLDYSEEARRLFEEIIKRKKAEEAVKALKGYRSSVQEVKGNIAAEVIREARERH